MPDQQSLTVNFSNPHDVSKILPVVPHLQSHSVNWGNVNLQVYGTTPAWKTPSHKTDHHLVIIFVDNEFSTNRRIGEEQNSMLSYRGDVCLIPTKADHRCSWDQEASGFMVLTVDPHFVSQMVYESADPERTELMPTFSRPDGFIFATALALKDALETDGAGSRLYAESLSQSLAMHLLRCYSAQPPKICQYEDGLSRDQLQQTIDYIQANLDQTIKLADIATLLGMSQYYFCRLFRQSMGIPPYQYVIRQRIEWAKQLLRRDRQTSISDIALDCGFANQSHLSKYFRQLTGTTPRAYRRG